MHKNVFVLIQIANFTGEAIGLPKGRNVGVCDAELKNVQVLSLTADYIQVRPCNEKQTTLLLAKQTRKTGRSQVTYNELSLSKLDDEYMRRYREVICSSEHIRKKDYSRLYSVSGNHIEIVLVARSQCSQQYRAQPQACKVIHDIVSYMLDKVIIDYSRSAWSASDIFVPSLSERYASVKMSDD